MGSNITFFHFISLITAFLCISLGIFLFFIKSKSNKANIFLGLLVWSYSFWFYPGAFDALGILNKVPHFIELRLFSATLIGVLTYLYCKASIQKKALKFKSIYYHFIPILINFFIHIPILLKTKEEKLIAFQNIITKGEIPESSIFVLIKVIFTLIYAFFSIRIVFHHLKHLKKTNASIDYSFHKWLLFLGTSLLFPIIIIFFFKFIKLEWISVTFILFSVSTFIFIIYISLILQPNFFHQPLHKIDTLTSNKIKYQGSNLQEQQKNIYKSKLLKYMEESKAYLDSELTINTFSKQVKIPPYYLSQIINQHLNCNFIDFINSYRINEVKEKLSDSSLNNYTVMAIAYESGFNSKTAFYTTFKKNVKKTPSQFRREAINN